MFPHPSAKGKSICWNSLGASEIRQQDAQHAQMAVWQRHGDCQLSSWQSHCTHKLLSVLTPCQAHCSADTPEGPHSRFPSRQQPSSLRSAAGRWSWVLQICHLLLSPLPRPVQEGMTSLLPSSMGKHWRVPALLPNRDHPLWPDGIQVGLQVDTGGFCMQPETCAQTTSAVCSNKRERMLVQAGQQNLVLAAWPGFASILIGWPKGRTPRAVVPLKRLQLFPSGLGEPTIDSGKPLIVSSLPLTTSVSRITSSTKFLACVMPATLARSHGRADELATAPSPHPAAAAWDMFRKVT